MLLPESLLDVADLVLGRCCIGCGAVGRDLCTDCLAAIRRRPRLGAIPAASVPAWIGAPYGGLIRTLLLAYKDGQRSLARPLGILLADVIAAALSAAGQRAGFLIRVPGHRRPARGFDALGLVVRHASIELRRRSLVAPGLAILARAHDSQPSKELTRQQRRASLAHSFVARPTRGDIGLPGGLPMILVDDVMTTGATMAEAVRALAAVGMTPRCAAVITAADRGLAQPGYAGDEPRTRSVHDPPVDS